MVTAVVTILIFLILISLHEFGHFIMAKMSKVPVLEFAIGMGPAVFKKQRKETLYSIRAFPIGGYCKLEGEDDISDNPNSFAGQKLWKRFLVIVAGAVLNLILGFVLFVIIVGMIGPFRSNVVDTVDERAYISQSGLLPGDKIVEINGKKVNFFEDISFYTLDFAENEEFEITVIRNRERFTLKSKASKDVTAYTYGDDYVEITDEINGVAKVNKQENAEVPAEYVGTTHSQTRYIIGFIPKTEELTARNIIPQAWNYTVFVTKSVYKALFDLVSGKEGLDNVSGPVGVIAVVDSAVNSGSDSLLNILFIMAMLTINLGIFNLLPIPALDGGRLVFLVIELITGKQVPPEKEGFVHGIGMILLLLLAVVIFFNDIIKMFFA